MFPGIPFLKHRRQHLVSACFRLLLLRQARHVNFLYSYSKFVMTTTWSPEADVSWHSFFETPTSALDYNVFHAANARKTF